MPADFHQVIELQCKVHLVLLHRIFHDKHRIFLGERLSVELHRTVFRRQRYPLMRNKPAQHLSVFKILFAVLVGCFPCILVYYIIAAR